MNDRQLAGRSVGAKKKHLLDVFQEEFREPFGQKWK